MERESFDSMPRVDSHITSTPIASLLPMTCISGPRHPHVTARDWTSHSLTFAPVLRRIYYYLHFSQQSISFYATS